MNSYPKNIEIMESVSIIQNILLGGYVKGEAVLKDGEILQRNMRVWSMRQLREAGCNLSYEEITSEQNENAAEYDMYYANTSRFCRIVLQAAAASFA